MCKYTFEFSSKLFVFVYSGAKLLHFEEISIVKCNRDIRKCILKEITRIRNKKGNHRSIPLPTHSQAH